MKTYGNMKIESIDKSGIATVRCHCDSPFFVDGLFFEEKTGVLKNARPNGQVMIGKTPVKCSKCGCSWKTSGFPEPEMKLPDLPKEWLFFIAYVHMDGEADEERALIGMGFSIHDFTCNGVLGLLNQYGKKIKTYRVEQIPIEEFERIHREEHAKSRINFVSSLLGTLLGG